MLAACHQCEFHTFQQKLHLTLQENFCINQLLASDHLLLAYISHIVTLVRFLCSQRKDSSDLLNFQSFAYLARYQVAQPSCSLAFPFKTLK